MAVIHALGSIPGINITFWGVISIIRSFTDSLTEKNLSETEKKLIDFMKENSVAICIAAKNEGRTIKTTVKNLLELVPSKNIFLASDGSTDNTSEIARKMNINLIENNPNIGKAKSLVKLLNNFNILNKYQFVFFVDADINVSPKFLDFALPAFSNPEISAVCGHAEISWKGVKAISIESFIKAYRLKLYSILQYAIRYGQTSNYLNASPVAPGFAVVFRSTTLKNIRLATEGLIIEDFNTAFQIYKKKLGKIFYHPKIWAYGCEPFNLNDYISQVNRWNLGFWQTLLKHKIWASMFSLATLAFIFESLAIAVFIYTLPVIIFIITIKYFPEHFAENLVSVSEAMGIILSPFNLFIGVIFIDYIITVVVAIIFKKPILLFYGLGFIFFRFLDSILILTSLFQAIFNKTSGVWVSPQRK